MKKTLQPTPSLFDRFENFCETHSKTILTAILGIFTLMSLLLFNLRVSIGGDDSTYIIRAVNFINEGRYPSFQGPIYPIFLSLFIALTGIKLGLLKLTSFILMLATMIGFYRIFRNRIPYSLIFIGMLVMSASSYFMFFTSQTYSEALFMALQIPVFYLLFKTIDAGNSLSWKKLLLMSLFIVIAYLTRTVGLGILIAILIFFSINKKYKQAGITLTSFIVILFAFLLVKNMIWSNGFFDGNQASTLIYKHPYDKSQGLETFGGYLMRFVDNSNLYLGKQFLKMTGLKNPDSLSCNPFVTLILYALFVFAVIRSFKQNKHLLFTAIYTATMLGITFIVLQKIWDQYRLIVPFFPFILLLLLYALNELRILAKNKFINIAFTGLIVFATLSSFAISFDKVDLLTLRKNLKGNKLLGYTDDWVHYLSMAEYVDKKLPENAYVAVRKPNMARLYANGRKFYGIYRFDTEDPDELLKQLKEKNVTHIVMASLRKNPAIYNKQTINTIQRYMYIIIQKYPMVFEAVHLIGKQEPAYLFKIHYDRLTTKEELENNKKQNK